MTPTEINGLVKQARWDKRYCNGHVPMTLEDCATALEAQASEIAEFNEILKSNKKQNDYYHSQLEARILRLEEALNVISKMDSFSGEVIAELARAALIPDGEKP